MKNSTQYRVWNIINPPRSPRFYPVASPEEGAKLINEMADRQLKNRQIVSNVFGLEIFEDGEWTEWYNEMGKDVDEAFGQE